MFYSIADKDAEIFILYHYNGFSGVSNNNTAATQSKNGMMHRKLTRLTLFRRSQESAIGQSIAFSSGGSTFGGSSMSAIEEVSVSICLLYMLLGL